MNRSTRSQHTLVSRAFIEKNWDRDMAFSVPSVSPAPVSKRVALYHAFLGRPVVATVNVSTR